MNYSKRQAEMILHFGENRSELNYGCVGCGKTFSTMHALAMYLYQRKPWKLGFALAGKTLTNIKRDMCKELQETCGDNFRYIGGEQSATSILLFGHRINLVSLADSRTRAAIRGLSVWGMVQDEVSTCTEDDYNELQARIRGELPPNEKFWYVGLTNPDAPNHWLYKKYIEPWDTSRIYKGMKIVKWDKTDAMFTGAEDFYKELEVKYAGTCYLKRFVYGEWAAAEGLVYERFDATHHVVDLRYLDKNEIAYYKIGIDFGITNMTAILVSGRTRQGEDIIIDEVCLNGTDDLNDKKTITDISKEVVRLCYKYAPRYLYYDPSAEALYIQLLRDGIRNAEGADNSVQDGIMKVTSNLNTGRLFIGNNCVNTINEFGSYARKPGSDDVIKKDDHCMDALRYLIYTPYRQGRET